MISNDPSNNDPLRVKMLEDQLASKDKELNLLFDKLHILEQQNQALENSLKETT